ncbi:MAG TPA: BACON domain-containing carbohydrate-binding protein [Candidatus Acidoferrum sp.]|nr:BACON domain-containing carbohydrate-binding protein [Candidatus Acidoferrum sp.]
MRDQIKATYCWALLVLGVFLAPATYGACTYDISPSGRGHGHPPATRTFAVTAETNCTWTPSSGAIWITIQPGWSGVGTGVVTYAVATNASIVGRTGIVTVAGQTFEVRQDPTPCNYSLTPTTYTHGYNSAPTSFDVTATPGCSWGVTNDAPWVIFTGVTSGTGNGTVNYAVLTNTTPVWRTSMVAVATDTYTLIQKGAGCVYELSPTNTTRGHSPVSGTNFVNVINTQITCSWFVINTNNWITISNSSGTNDGFFIYTLATNASSISRTGTVTVWNHTFLVVQTGTPCKGSISPSSSTPGAEAETRVVDVTTPFGCPWSVTNNVSWITVVPMKGTNNGPVDVQIAANSDSVGRTGTVTIAGDTYTVKQEGANCTYRLDSTNRTHGYAARTDDVEVQTLSVCVWTVVNTNAWLTFAATNGVGTSNISYTVEANSQIADRAGVVVIGGQQFFITQRGIGCPASLSPENREHGNGATNRFVTISIPAACPWNAVTTNLWITLATNGGVGGGPLDYAIAANTIGLPRTGYIMVEDAAMTINQLAAPCTNSITPSSFTHSPAQEIGSVAVNGTVACSLTITNTNSWITIISGAGDTTGSTNVIYQVDANLNGSARSGGIAIGNKNYTVNQNAATCNYKLSPAQRSHGVGGVERTRSRLRSPLLVRGLSSTRTRGLLSKTQAASVPPISDTRSSRTHRHPSCALALWSSKAKLA